MTAELVACPHCGKETWLIMPVGQKLVKIASGPLALGRGNHNQKTTCRECRKQFYVKTGGANCTKSQLGQLAVRVDAEASEN